MRRRHRRSRLSKLGDLMLFPIVAVALLFAVSYLPRDEIAGDAYAIDGDSLMLGDTEIRLFGIDAPEARQSCLTSTGESWPCGREATRALGQLLDGPEITCSEQEEDRYGRAVSRCFSQDLDVAEALVSRGLAVVLTNGLLLYAGSEADARAEKLGIWQGDFEEPAAWREQNE